LDGKDIASIELRESFPSTEALGVKAAMQLLDQGGKTIADKIQQAAK